MEDEFYVSLPANSSAGFFPENTNAHYFTKLEKRINLKKGEWEVAATDLFYPNSWKNVSHGTIWTMRMGGGGQPISDLTKPKELDGILRSFLETNGDKTISDNKIVSLSGGRVDSVPELIAEITRAFGGRESMNNLFHLQYDSFVNRASINVRAGVLLFMSDDLYEILGFRRDASLVTGVHVSSSTCDPHRGFRTIYVYTNIVENRPVGDSRVPLLRSVPTKGLRNTRRYEPFLMRQYLKAASLETDSIEVRLTMDAGVDVPFDSGLVFINLHIRRKKDNIFSSLPFS